MREALAAYRDAHELNGAALAQANLGFALMGQGRIAAGVHEVEAGIRFVHEAGSLPMEEQLLGELSRMYEQAGLYREAMATTRKQQALAKELFHTERDQAVATLQERFDSAERQRQIDQLAQANRAQDAELRVRRMQQIGLAAAVALALLAAGASFWLYRRTRTANEALAAARGQAESALTEKNMFLATASHDLRQPVAAIGLLVGLARDRVADAGQAGLLDRIQGAVRALEGLLRGLLDLSRLDSAAGAPLRQAVPLQALFDGLALHHQADAQARGLRLLLRPTRLQVDSDPVLLDQVLRNLVGNALHHTRRGGVLVAARRHGAHGVRLQVWDTGIGIPADQQQRVFEPFVQLHDPWPGRHPGQGLGLAIVRRAVDLLGHPLLLRSVPGQGSCFSIGLPLAGGDLGARPGPVAHP